MPPTTPSTRRMALLLAGLAMFGPFSIDTIFPAFSQLGRSLAVDQVAIQQTISVYLLAYGLMSIAHGPLSDAWGRKRVILGGLALFIAGSIGCALSQDLPTLLAFRALQGLSAGVGMIVGRAVIRDLFHGPDAQRLMSQVSMIFGIAPAIAPIIGGWILLSGGGWPLIFWFLVVFGLVLLIATLTWLPETHPVEARTPLQFRRLLHDYVRIGFNPRFQRLAAAGSFNFAGIFLYIASAPVLIMQHLKLGEGDFAWLFIPTIGGMTLGSFLSGRMAGRMQPVRQIRIGFICCGAAALDMYPQQRGLASSLQAFTQLMTNTVVAGVLSPLLSEHPRHLAIGMTGFFLLGWLFWRWERRSGRRLRHRQATEAVPLEPADHL
ncbi:multidrug effflux MFS transporter [Xanthomonas campestris pv. trichodesmae]|uniref:Bcr/CflA family drug resistance efflux transporter n=2 Tax=Xanthomonas citri TaxID=346 RepID=A0AB33CJI8_XANCI|nr:multidrug effflux MFS transporter [Xanthomonas citri]ASK93183.1 Bcr/CflA family drug resistance efflux transporter [Xanthomonas citri pv. vignicola]MBV6780566.1 multidrug effflux MFS transporter [Xanthomonas campestris pv. trichodesmae]MBZ3918888.1 MFS transporter [Xanthomonas campestris pv. trichodesmae]MBZ3924310.1 MFS transporter [Xanthomonas citri pv. sesbaniae]